MENLLAKLTLKDSEQNQIVEEIVVNSKGRVFLQRSGRKENISNQKWIEYSDASAPYILRYFTLETDGRGKVDFSRQTSSDHPKAGDYLLIGINGPNPPAINLNLTIMEIDYNFNIDSVSEREKLS